MTKPVTRDDAGAILLAIALDMQVEQSPTQQARESTGRDDAGGERSVQLDNASARHGAERVAQGFDIAEVVSEYCALRAIVLRLWLESLPRPDLANIDDIDDITRFNESMDQSLAAAVNSYTERVDRSRLFFLAILSHDLRNPLNCIRMAARFASQGTGGLSPERMLAVIGTESQSMETLINDLLDFTSTWLGDTLPLHRQPVDLQELCGDVIDAFRAAYPQRTVRFHPRGDLSGNWDPARLRQVVSNLLGNAFQHGSAEGPIEVSAASEGSTVVLRVHNEGTPIPPEALPTLFNPLLRHVSAESTFRRAPGSIGLGLYIVREIVDALGGTIAVTSTAQQGTTFTVRIPRHTSMEDEEFSNPKDARTSRENAAAEH